MSPFVATFFSSSRYRRNVGTIADMAGQRPTPPSVFELHAELDRARLIALQADRAEAARVPVGAARDARVAEDDAVGHVAALRLEAQPVALMEAGHLEDAHVLHDVHKAAHRAV